MTFLRLVAIVLILGISAVAWFTLGASVVHRTGEMDYALVQQVMRLWGGRHEQLAPTAWYEQQRQVAEEIQSRDPDGKLSTRTVTSTVTDRIPVPLVKSRVTVDLDLDHRRKGLLWYDTYAVGFDGTFVIRNETPSARVVFVQHTFPSPEAIYDGFRFEVAGRAAPMADDLSSGLVEPVGLEPGAEAPVHVAYRSRGLGEWSYALGRAVTQARDLELTMTTDFTGIDFPAGTMSPTSRELAGEGYRLVWKFDSVVTGQKIGMDLPNRLNPGPLAARITFFAPVSLLFFVTVMVVLGVLRGRSLHPMNYVFLSAAFFAFHLLLAYLADHVNIHTAFVASSATSIALVLSYLRLVTGSVAALLEAGLAQLVYLVLFSYAFFFEGYTGLTVTIGSILTLFALMQLTGRLDWAVAFARRGRGATGGQPGAAAVDLCMP